MIRFAIAATPFTEHDQRIFGEPVATMYFDEYDVASGNAIILSERFQPVVDALAGALGADGIAVDVYPIETMPDGTCREYAVVDSIEVVPGRPLITWYCEECHDNGCPRLELNDEL